ncbi:MAG: phenylalanine--tRNA ligase subunit beta [Candidatus Omnitrophica bacterium]|nr:phenylalanine--tRNA ligase subunit beta [Candidatus Omnitrophota bacterium]
MKILFSWLKEFIEISLHPEALAERLTLSGAEVTGLTQADGDWVFELEITPNRPDLLSHLGMAREIAAILGRPFRPTKTARENVSLMNQPPPSFPVVIEDTQGCARYVGIVMERVRVGESPPEMARRLIRLGVRPVNNVVDVTNLCLLELGQPLHAFDLDRLEGRSIRVRTAGAKETLVTLDGVSRALPPDTLVIADAKRPVALAGIMGGRDTEISSKTKRIFLESACFHPDRIRRTVRLTKLSSDSSYRFERGVDLQMVPMAAVRAARWIQKVAGGKIEGGLINVGEPSPVRRRIPLRPKQAQSLLGMRIYPAQQRRYLERLGCRVTGTQQGYRVEPPSWRSDLKIPEDLYEELARLWGYDRCPTSLPPVPRQEISSRWQPVEDHWPVLQTQIRRLLVAAGAQEIMTYTLLSQEGLSRCRLAPSRRIANPLSREQECLRPSLLPGALEVAARNLHRKTAAHFQFFELGHLYEREKVSGEPSALPDRALPFEKRTLSVLAAGVPLPAWGGTPKGPSILYLKGIIQFLCERLRIGLPREEILGEKEIQKNDCPCSYLLAPAVQFRLDDQLLGWTGRVDPKVLSAHEIPEEIPLIYAELNLELIIKTPAVPLKVQPLAKVAPVLRDLAILVPAEILHEAILQAIQTAGRPLLKEATLFDFYQGPQVPPGEKSLAFRLEFSAGDRTLTEEEVAAAFRKILDSLGSRFNASIR